MTNNSFFDEIYNYHTSGLPFKERYKRLYLLLDRITKELMADSAAEYTSLFSRLYALCRLRDYPLRTIELFRVNARKVIRGEFTPEEEDYLYDLKALCEAIAFFYDLKIPLKLKARLPQKWRNFTEEPVYKPIYKKTRLIVSRWDDTFLYGFREEDESPDKKEVKVAYAEYFSSLSEEGMLYKGIQLNLLSVVVKNGIFYPALIVLEPDFLIDISSLSACMQTYGHHPLNYLINKFKPKPLTKYILLGNTVDVFLSDCVNERKECPATFQTSILHAFTEAQVDYSTCEGIDKEYFDLAQAQFNNVRQTVEKSFGNAGIDIQKDDAQLEASFICEALGLQGRMDLVTTDFTRLIEMKSGKADGWDTMLRPKEDHLLQMELYKQMVYYNMDLQPDKQVNGYLFYARYPKLFDQRTSLRQIQEAINLRNNIVANERCLRNGQFEDIIKGLSPELLNTKKTSGKLWEQYQYPQLQDIITPLTSREGLEKAYFDTLLTFIEREQFYSKIGDNTPDSGRGFAETWRTSLEQKEANGNILTKLKIENCQTTDEEDTTVHGIEAVTFSYPPLDENYIPNFRKGDAVLFYIHNTEDDTVLNRQIHRGTLIDITPDIVKVKLHERQRNEHIFQIESEYAMEHDYMDTTYTTVYRGLFSFLTAPASRRDLLLNRRFPVIDSTKQLTRRYLNKDIDQIVLQAKQAEDYFLLVGPPGTGKTSVALKSMVEEFSASTNEQGVPYSLLLLSYTNRAVDEICETLSSISPAPDYIRIGQEMNCEEAYRPHLLKYAIKKCKRRTDITQRLKECRIFVGTVAALSGKTSLFRLKQFDVAIIDEASQILEPYLLSLFCAPSFSNPKECAIRKFILIGDHKQLPAVVLENDQESVVNNPELRAIGMTNCRNSLFERLFALHEQKAAEGIIAMLHKQGRMHPSVSAFANRYFYGNQLDIVPLKHQQEKLPYKSFSRTNELEKYVATTRIGFIPEGYPPVADNNKTNRKEAAVVAGLVGTIYTLYNKNHLSLDPDKTIGIIVPFRNQIAMIRHELKKLNLENTDRITIDTVERFQGSQRDIILFSATISQPYQLSILSSPVECEGQRVDRKLNVALTRARKQMFITGNPDLLEREPVYKELIEFINSQNQ